MLVTETSPNNANAADSYMLQLILDVLRAMMNKDEANGGSVNRRPSQITVLREKKAPICLSFLS